MQGTIKNVVRDKGFGFIKGEDGHEYLFHRSTVAEDQSFDDLSQNTEVEFEPDEGPKGLRAETVRRV